MRILLFVTLVALTAEARAEPPDGYLQVGYGPRFALDADVRRTLMPGVSHATRVAFGGARGPWRWGAVQTTTFEVVAPDDGHVTAAWGGEVQRHLQMTDRLRGIVRIGLDWTMQCGVDALDDRPSLGPGVDGGLAFEWVVVRWSKSALSAWIDTGVHKFAAGPIHGATLGWSIGITWAPGGSL